MKQIVRTLPLLFFVLLFTLIAIIISGFWVRNQKISQIPQKVIDTAVSLFTPTQETKNISPDSGFTTTNDTVEVEIKNLEEGITLIQGKVNQPIVLNEENKNAKTTLKLELGANLFRITTLSSTDFSVIYESTFVYFRNEDALAKNTTAIYGKVVSTLGSNIELKSLISDNRYTLSTSSETTYLFVNPREDNDGKLDKALKDIDKLEVNDIIIGVGQLKNSVQETNRLISYSNKEPIITQTKPFKSGQIASVDTKKELLNLNGDKVKYYWDKNTLFPLDKSLIDLKKGQSILFMTSANSYGNLIITNILKL